MEGRQPILDELSGISPLLAGMERRDILSVPEGYFERLADAVLLRIRSANDINTELETVAPLLSTISRRHVYTVPAGYFNEVKFGVQGKAAAITGTGAKRFQLRSSGKWLQYAAAAVFAGVLITGAFLFTEHKKTVKVDYEQYSHIDIPSALDRISDEDLEKYLNTRDHQAAARKAPSPLTMELPEVKANVHLLSDEELTDYLNENTTEPEPQSASPVNKDSE
jgi:hypothetical protein